MGNNSDEHSNHYSIEISSDTKALFNDTDSLFNEIVQKAVQSKDYPSLAQKSEESYINIVEDVVDFSKTELGNLSEQKDGLRNKLVDFCLRILSAQFILMFVLLVCGGGLGISDKVIIAFMTSVFIETLGAIVIMIRFAFKSDEEVKIIDILNAVVRNYQKYSRKNKETNTDKGVS